MGSPKCKLRFRYGLVVKTQNCLLYGTKCSKYAIIVVAIQNLSHKYTSSTVIRKIINQYILFDRIATDSTLWTRLIHVHHISVSQVQNAQQHQLQLNEAIQITLSQVNQHNTSSSSSASASDTCKSTVFMASTTYKSVSTRTYINMSISVWQQTKNKVVLETSLVVWSTSMRQISHLSVRRGCE